MNKTETHIRNRSKNSKCIYINTSWEEKTITIHVSHKNLISCFLQKIPIRVSLYIGREENKEEIQL